MEKIDYLIAGAGLAAAKCAETLRKRDKKGRVMIVGDEPYRPYNRPPLSKGLLLGFDDPDQVFVHSADYYSENRIETMYGKPLVAADAAAKTVTVEGGVKLGYDKLLVATGTTPRRLKVPGSDLAGVHYLRTLDQSKAILGAIKEAKTAVIVGAGFIGMELAAAFIESNLKTTMIVRDDGLFAKLASASLSEFFTKYYIGKGVNIIFNDEVDSFAGSSSLSQVLTKNGTAVDADLAAVGIGVVPNIEWLAGSGVPTDNGVTVDEFLRSEAQDVFAAGDVAFYYDPIFQKKRRVEHWDNAIKQGELAAQNMLGDSNPVDAIAYFFSDMFELSWEWIGDNAGIDETVVRGDLDAESGSVFYLKNNQLRAAFLLMQGPEDREWAERMIKGGRDLSADKQDLGDTTIPLEAIGAR